MRQRKFVQHLVQGTSNALKSSENSVPPEDTFENFQITCVNEPLDYEQYLVRNKASILNDPHRDLIIFPQDEIVVLPLKRNSIHPNGCLPTASTLAELSAKSALARQVAADLTSSEWPFLYQPQLIYRGNFCVVPRDRRAKELIGTPVNQWYAIDHQGKPDNKSGLTFSKPISGEGGAPANGNGCINNKTGSGAASRSWTTAVASVRRAAASSGVRISGSGDSEPASRRTSATICLECKAVVCSRSEYQSHMRSLEGVLASSGSAANALTGVPPRRTLCIRQLTSQDLSKLRNRPPASRLGMEEDGQEGNSKSPPHLPIGLYLIAPADWGVSPTLQTSLQDSQSLIFFDVIQSAVAIGKLWIRLDRVSGSGGGGGSPRPSDQIASFFTLTAGNPSEVYICFESTDQRDQWLSSINLALKAELTRRHVGYASVDDLSAVAGDDAMLADGRLPDTESLRSSLQRFAQENELVVSHQRQKDRLLILSVYPEIRVPYDKYAEEAARRLEESRGLSDLMDRTVGANGGGLSARGVRLQETSPVTVDSDTFLRSLLPDARRQVESRRFLVSCLSLKTGLRASVEDASGTWQTDNPEPFFVTFFLASAMDGVRLSEEFCWNPNSSLIDAMLPSELFRHLPWNSAADSSTTVVGNGHPPPQRPTSVSSAAVGGAGGTKHAAPPPPTFKNPQGLITGNPAKLVRCRSALLSIDPHIPSNSLYLVFRVDKVLTGGISAATEKYLKANGKAAEAGDSPTASDMKAGTALHKSMAFFCKYLGRYRMPLAWGARWLFSRDTQVPLFRFDSGKVSDTALLQNVQLLARLLSISAGSSFSNKAQSDVASMSPAVLETVERSLKTETIPIQLRIAVNELPFEVLRSNSLTGLMSSQLAPVRYSDGPSDKPLLLKQTVPDFSPDEPVKELESFVSWRTRLTTKPTADSAIDYSDAWGLQSIQPSSIRSSLQFPDNKRDSIISSKSTTESVDSSTGGSLRFHLFGSTGGGLASKTGSLERLKGTGTGGDSKPTSLARDLASGEEAALVSRSRLLGMINPYRGFLHSLYVYPQSLNLNIKHAFARARNLCCFIELRDNDTADSQALKVFYTHPSPHRSLFDTWFNTSVVHHNSSPTFLDEAKLALPVVLTNRMHLLFRFYHVRCDLSPGDEKSASKKAIESPTGFAWLPLLQEDGNLLAGTFSLPVSQDLPAGYLSSTDPNSQSAVRFIEPSQRVSVTSADGDVVGAGRRASTRTEPSWLENKRPLFSVTLEPVSSVYTTDNHLARFFTTSSTKLMLYTRVASNMSITPKGVRMVSAPEKETSGAQLPPPARPTTITIQLSQLDITTGKLLCNSIKSLLLVEAPALVQFFPALTNQLIEIMLGAVAVGQHVLSVSTPSGRADSRESAWLDICQHMTLGSPGDLSKTAVGTLSVLLDSISTSLGLENNIQKATPGNNRPQLLKDYLEFSFDALKLSSAFSELYGIQVPCNTGQGLTDRCPSVHHAFVRGILSLLLDYSCPGLIAQRFLTHIWFFYDLIIKSLAQTLSSSKRIKLDRKDPSRLPAAFITDLTLMLRLIGKWMAKLCSLGNENANCRSVCNGSLRSGSGVSLSASSTLPPDIVDSPKHTPGVQPTSSAVTNLAESTACFLQQLLSLVDRGFVLQRLRDLLAMLAIRHHMSAVEVDRFNAMRYQLLQCFCESEFFVQINLPSLSPSYRSESDYDRRDEFHLTERFCQEHFVVGLMLQQVSCLLSGCADAGGWGAASSSHVHRQPLCLLRAQLAKLAFDARYAGSRQTQARICMLYLPLLRLSLENIAFLGPPGQSVKTAKTDYLRLRSNDRKNKEESKKSKSRSRGGKHGRNGGGGPADDRSTAGTSEQALARPRSLVSAGSWESAVNPAVSDSSNSSLSSVSVSSISMSLPKNAPGITTVSGSRLSSDSDGDGSSRESAAAHKSSTTASVSSYVTSDGRVNPDVLNQIAGFNPGGPLQRVQWRREGSIPKTSLSAADGLTVASRQQSGSTLTLTGPGDDDDTAGGVGEKTLTWLDDDGVRCAPSNGVQDDDRDYHSDVDEQDDLWADRVLELAGVIPDDPTAKSGYSRPKPVVPPRPSRCAEAPGQPPTTTASSNPSSANRPPQQRSLQNLEAQFTFAFRPHIHRRFTTAAGSQVVRLPDRCQRDLYVCLLHLLSSLAEEPLTTLLRELSSQDRVNFLLLLTYIVKHLKYRGRKCISRFNTISTSAVAQRGLTGTLGSLRANTAAGESVTDDSEYKALLEANLATEAGLIILDTLNLFTSTFKKELENGKPSNPLFQGLIDVYVCLLTSGQSETLLKHVFASLRVFVSRFSKVLFSETTDGLASLCTVGLRASNLNLLAVEEEEEERQQQRLSFAPGSLSPAGRPRLVFDSASANTLSTLRLEACGLLYRLWRASFEVFSVRGFHRVHLQMVISLSKLVGDIGPEFETSLSLLHSLAEMDVQRAGGGGGGAYRERSVSPFATSGGLALLGSNGKQFLEDIDDLIKRIRTVLTATDEMRRHSDDPERLIDLQYSLAKSYASNPVLRRAWLEKLAESHLSLKNMAEVAMAKLHIAALMAEYLRKRGCLDSEFPQGCDAFCKVSTNIRREETCQLADPSILELAYNQEDLLRDLADAAVALESAGLFEALQPVYALVTPVYEARRDFMALSRIYHHLGDAYKAINDAESRGHRLFASYYRVTFYGKAFEGFSGKSFIYRTGPCQKLSVFIQSIMNVHTQRLGRNKVQLLVDNYVSLDALSPDKAYIQVTFVEPYVPETSDDALTAFERQHDVRQFFFETPFIMQPGMSVEACLTAPGPRRTDDLTAQWLRRTTLTTEATFPHLRCRLEVTSTQDTDLSPLDAAIEAIQMKTRELSSHLSLAPRESPHSSLHPPPSSRSLLRSEQTASGAPRVPLLLDMQLQGALLPTVNQGPMAYAHAFLSPENAILHPPAKVQRLKKLFLDFLTKCLALLTRYQHIMIQVHEEKYRAMREAFDRYRVDLSNLLKEEIVIDETRQVVCPKSELPC